MDDEKKPPRAAPAAPGPPQGGDQTSALPPDTRDISGRFVKGSSGNPGGKPKGVFQFRAQAQAMSELMLSRLKLIALRTNGQAAVTAARVILAYAWGNPRQSVELTGANGEPLPGAGPPIDLLPMLRRLVKETEIEPAPPAPAIEPPKPEGTGGGDPA